MKTVAESLEALERWRRGNEGYEWELRSEKIIGRIGYACQATARTREKSTHINKEFSIEAALHKLCEALGI